MDEKTIVGICLTVLVLMVWVGTIEIKDTANDFCNKNGTVTDVYYNHEIGKCALTLCLQMSSMPGFNKSQCYYDMPPIDGLEALI